MSSRPPPLSHSYSSPKLGAAAIYSTSSPSGSPRPYFAQHLPGAMSPYRDASARYAHLGSPRISSLSRDATAALKGSNYPTSSSRPTSPTPGSRSPSPSSDSDRSSRSSSPGLHAHADNGDRPDRPLLTRGDSSSRRDLHPESYHDDPSAAAVPNIIDSPRGLKRVHQLQPIDTKGESDFQDLVLPLSHLLPLFLRFDVNIAALLSSTTTIADGIPDSASFFE
ncbi:hypothetical protein EX895_005817 [Sporisorium graminicola]|uniref:Uncharacterized protein n=1 Tax=Sporisorium graminicola TaxID=280036 RepID=A0A4U7KLW3_9BASI|nr:hypothetical protein EX895_005817 [Sporisorium graminicola]TKY84737.1 hypothetical protein EX895_005817 [Sporisorium graminicola]